MYFAFLEYLILESCRWGIDGADSLLAPLEGDKILPILSYPQFLHNSVQLTLWTNCLGLENS